MVESTIVAVRYFADLFFEISLHIPCPFLCGLIFLSACMNISYVRYISHFVFVADIFHAH